MTEKHNQKTTMTQSYFEPLPLRKAFLKALAPDICPQSSEKQQNALVVIPKVARKRASTHVRYSKPLFLKEAREYNSHLKIEEEEKSGKRCKKIVWDDEDNESFGRVVYAKQLLMESGIVFIPSSSSENGLYGYCRLDRQTCPKCNKGCTEVINLDFVRCIIESRLSKYTFNDREISPLFVVSSIADLLLNMRDDVNLSSSERFDTSEWDAIIRQRKFLRRMLSPLVGYCKHCDYLIGCLTASLVDVLLRVQSFQPHVLYALLETLKTISNCIRLDDEDFSTLKEDIYYRITRHIERVTCITRDSVKMVWTSFCGSSALPRFAITGEGLMHEVKKNGLQDSDMELDHVSRKLLPLSSSNDILQTFLRLTDGQKVLTDRLSHHSSRYDRILLRAVRMKMLQQLLLEPGGKLKPSVGDSPTTTRQSITASIVNNVECRKSLLMRIRHARSAAEKHRNLRSDQLKEQEHPEMILSSCDKGEEDVAEERATSSVEAFLDSSDVTKEDFILHSMFINKVNGIFASHKFHSTVRQQHPSRPGLAHVHLPLECHQQILNILFDKDGSLRNEIVEDIDLSRENDPRYIDFGNTAENGRNDRRFQVGIKKQILGGCPVKTRLEIENLFVKLGILSPKMERLDEIGILIGGTEDQSLHHDIARKFVHWYKDPIIGEEVAKAFSDEDEALVGWEVDRIQYNRMASSPHAPAAVLIALGPTAEMLLGVQKDQILRDSIGGKECTILRGDGSKYKIVRENNNIVVLSVSGGVVFTGEFPHCGVRNFRRGTKDDELMEEICFKIRHFADKYSNPRQRILRDKAILDVLCHLPGVNRLSRLHCSIAIRDGNESQIPFNMIGYANCFQNERDDRCYQSD